MTKREKWDMSRPDTKAKRDEIVHGTFVKEGTMVAFPTCFPGVTVPIPYDESHITALTTSTDGAIYGGTSGRRTHCFVGMFHGITGLVFDLGVVEGANRCEGVCCTGDEFFVGVNGKGGGRLIKGRKQPLPFDLLQEWWFTRTPLHDLGRPIEGERIVDLATAGGKVLGITESHLFGLRDGEEIEILAELNGPAEGDLGVEPTGEILGTYENGIWRYDPVADEFEPDAVHCNGDFSSGVSWAADTSGKNLYCGDGSGKLFSLDFDEYSLVLVGEAPLAPIGPMATTTDGRLFGFCGHGISKLFCYDSVQPPVRDLGAAVSVIERRRYGYEFGAATPGRDGEIVFGEDDDLGHLWLYFPRVRRADAPI
jgi:hypothetical protein